MYSILKTGGDGYVRDDEGTYYEIICDNLSDIKTLPTGIGEESYDRPRPGSTAVITGARCVYVLSLEREWVSLVED